MDPKDVLYLGYIFEERIYYDVCLSMGSKSAAYCCQRTTNSITYIFKKFGFDDVNYLDDLGAAEEESKADDAFNCLGWILSSIGIKESKNKATPPSCIATFLGILYNTRTMTLQITPERLVEIRKLLQEWQHKETMNLQELQSLLGKLNFACSTVRSGRVFVSRIINELKGFSTQKRKVSKQLKGDINWWINFMEIFDGITIMPPVRWDPPDMIFSTDSCLTSCGGWSYMGNNTGEAFHAKFPNWIRKQQNIFINELELLALIIGIKKWIDEVENRNLLPYCDNQVCVDIVNKGKASNSFSQSCLREICYLMATKNACLKLIHLSTEENRISDSLSRWSDPQQRNRFFKLTEGIDVKFLTVNAEEFGFSNNW